MLESSEFLDLVTQETRGYAKNLLQNLHAALTQGAYTVACAESVTGGMLSEALTRLPKSSNFFMGGIICYHPRIKVEAVGLDAALLRQFGVVSAPVAEALAIGIAKRMRTRVGVSTTGQAGPDTISGLPVGTVFVGLSVDGKTQTRRLDLQGDRQQIRQAAVLQALRLLDEALRTG